MTDIRDDLDATLAHVWHLLETGAADSDAPARTLVLATVGVQGGAEARMVILRGVLRDENLLHIHTDIGSHKIAEIATDPSATLLIWDSGQKLQVRLRSTLAVRPGTAEEWARVPAPSRRAYGSAPPPGQPIASPDDARHGADPASFAVIEARVEEIETLCLSSDGHRRARFRCTDGFAGQWLAP